jgi:AcrR family transcriptional regulator
MVPRQTPEERRQAILAAAIGVFAQHGFDAATTDEIARAAGLSKGGLYWHFKSKDDILAALLEQFFNQELVVLEQLTLARDSTGIRLRQLGAQAADAMLQLESSQSVALEFYALAARQAHVRARIQSYYQRYHQRLADLIQQGFDKGEFRHGTAEQAALLLIAQLEGMALMWAIAPQPMPLREQVAAAIDLALHGLVGHNHDRGTRKR